AVTVAAVEHARNGGGPTLIEGLTYRIGAHTNSDDPTRYRNAGEVAVWAGRDPIERLEKYLLSQGALTPEDRARFADAGDAVADETREAMTRDAVVDPLELFEHVYATPRPALEEQRRLLAAELAEHAELEAESQGTSE
ncbi:MAG: pdhA, partial [Cryobacterium sp.]|nr:pdhA [Cryobacterium sp.]